MHDAVSSSWELRAVNVLLLCEKMRFGTSWVFYDTLSLVELIGGRRGEGLTMHSF